MRVLVACEYSGIVRNAFLAKGHDAWSCDVIPTEQHPVEKHLQGDVLELLDDRWDLMIAHPPCTYLCRNSGGANKGREWVDAERERSREFFMRFINAPVPKICVENPVPLKKSNLPPYTQIIQPWQHGHDYSKKTCLWLKGLPNLAPTNIVDVTYITTPGGHRYTAGWYKMPRNSRARSRTFQGIADAMAEQWGKEE